MSVDVPMRVPMCVSMHRSIKVRTCSAMEPRRSQKNTVQAIIEASVNDVKLYTSCVRAEGVRASE